MKFVEGAPAGAAITAVAAIATTLLSALIAWFTSRRAVRLEFDKARLETQASAIQRLIEKRLDVYPGFYQQVSLLIADIRSGTTSLEALQGVSIRIDAWDAEHGVVLGPDTTNHSYAFRAQLRRYIRRWQMDDDDELLRTREDLLRRAEGLELALRADLGIYGVRLRNTDGTYEFPVPQSYYAHIDETRQGK